MKFKVGDKVKILNNFYDEAARGCEVTISQISYDQHLYIFHDLGYIETANETELEYISSGHRIWNGREYTSDYLNTKIRDEICECGAKHTSRPNYHMQYCPLHT